MYNLNATVGQDGQGHIKDTVSIELRPKEVEQRLKIGRWEIDTVLDKPGTGGLVTVWLTTI